MLTIAVPTYNRPEQLLDCIGRLLPQMDKDCELRIYDNRSTKPASEVLADLLKQYPQAKVTVIRNQANLGMLGNIMRCMEDCPTSWVVMCGDDDPPMADYVAKTKRAIAKYPEAIFISFGFVAQKRSSDFATNGLSEFVRGNWVFGDPLSLSACAFRMDPLRPFFSSAYMYAYTLAPHLAVVLAALRAQGGQCGFVADQIADCGEDFSLESWSRIWLPSHVLLLEMIPDAADRAEFSKKLLPYMVSQSYLARMMIDNSLKTGADNTFLFDSRMKLRSMVVNSPAIFVKRVFFRLLVRNPRFGSCMMKWVSRLKLERPGFDSSKENLFKRV